LIGGEATQLRFCATFLETLGFSVMVAEDFRDGMRSLATAKPWLVILDARTSGLDPTAWLRITEVSEVRPKIFVVADAAVAPNSEIAALGVDGYLQRPIRSLDLVRAAELAAR
jgi:DNA-binding response OmpR family regulator